MASPLSIELQVAVTVAEDIGRGTARLDEATRSQIGANPGDIIEIRGHKTTGALVIRASKEDEGKRLVRIEALTRRNAGVSMGDRVLVSRLECPTATSMTISPIYSGSSKLDRGPGLDEFVLNALARRPFVRGDVFLIPGLFLKPDSRSVGGEPVPFVVSSTMPEGIVQVGRTTRLTVSG